MSDILALFQALGRNMELPNDIPPPSKARLSAGANRSTRFCARDCNRTLTASQPPQNADLYEAGSRLCKPLSNTNNYFIGGGSSILTFTPTGEYPCELHVTPRLSDWVGTDIGTVSSAF